MYGLAWRVSGYNSGPSEELKAFCFGLRLLICDSLKKLRGFLLGTGQFKFKILHTSDIIRTKPMFCLLWLLNCKDIIDIKQKDELSSIFLLLLESSADDPVPEG
jgi:hypothetical protein